MSELQGMSVMAGYFGVLWLTWFILWARAQDKSRRLKVQLEVSKALVLDIAEKNDELLHESQSLRADLRELEEQDIEVEMDLTAFDDDDDFDDSEEWKRG